MADYRLTIPAENDLYGIWAYIAEDNPDAADLVFDYLHAQCNALAATPHIGKNRDELSQGLLSFTVGKAQWRSRFQIYYGISDFGIDIYRILEGHRDITEDYFS